MVLTGLSFRAFNWRVLGLSFLSLPSALLLLNPTDPDSVSSVDIPLPLLLVSLKELLFLLLRWWGWRRSLGYLPDEEERTVKNEGGLRRGDLDLERVEKERNGDLNGERRGEQYRRRKLVRWGIVFELDRQRVLGTQHKTLSSSLSEDLQFFFPFHWLIIQTCPKV